MESLLRSNSSRLPMMPVTAGAAGSAVIQFRNSRSHTLSPVNVAYSAHMSVNSSLMYMTTRHNPKMSDLHIATQNHVNSHTIRMTLLHCWVSNMWSQAAHNQMTLFEVTQYGWKIVDDYLECGCDSNRNRALVRERLFMFQCDCLQY